MIRNCDGTPFQLSGLQTFDPNNPELNLIGGYDQELIQIAGAPIFYHEVFIQVKNTLDTTYREDRGKMWATEGIQLWGYYEPIASQNVQNAFGIDSPDEIKFTFNYQAVLKAIGHPPKIGSRLFTPHKRENWEVITRAVADFILWGELHLVIIAGRFQDNLTTNAGVVSQRMPDFKLNEGQMFKGGGGMGDCNC